MLPMQGRMAGVGGPQGAPGQMLGTLQGVNNRMGNALPQLAALQGRVPMGPPMGGMPQPQGMPNRMQAPGGPMQPQGAPMQRMPPSSGPNPMQPQMMMAEGGKVGITMNALRAISDALNHLANKDAPAAAQTLRASREAMAHPDVASAVGTLRSNAGIPGASNTLSGLLEQSTNQHLMPTMARGGQMSLCPTCGHILR
jgi:hypothetical protein